MKIVTNLIVGKDVASGDGFVDIVDKGQTALVGGETVGDTDIIFIRQELPNSDIVISLPIRGARVRKFSGASFDAETLQVTTVDPVNVLNNTKYLLRISITSLDQQDPIRQSFEVETDSSATVTELVTLLKDAINGDKDIEITATGTTTLILTADAPKNIVNHSVPLDTSGARFEVGLDDGFDSSATVVLTTAPDPGVGNFNQVRILEFETIGYKGHLNRVMFQDSPTFHTINGTDYDVYVIEHLSPTELFEQINERVQITYVLIPAAPATFDQGAFETILNGYMASTPGAFNPVNL